TYSIQTETDIEYGTATDFAGTERTLLMDVSVPTNDSPPTCGRPLMVIVHGGAWITGNKNEDAPPIIRRDFAERGYVTASVNYRLGQFNTNQFINCNIDLWNCYNMTDSSEWYRANYRGIQDVNGAIRYLVAHADDYNIDPYNVFLVGESAGAFVALGVTYLDSPDEVLQNLVGEYPDAPPPNDLFEVDCIRKFNLAVDIDSMDLDRPALGSYLGDLNPDAEEFKIRGVGSFYGGVFNNLFTNADTTSPILYMYHQPCDLVVPYNRGRLLSGLQDCAMGFPTFCGFIINRPYAYGSVGIKTMIDQLAADGTPGPAYLLDNTTSTFNCAQQVLGSNMQCHAIDNFGLRTGNMAAFFATRVDICTSLRERAETNFPFTLYPNPSPAGTEILAQGDFQHGDRLRLFDLHGRLLQEQLIDAPTQRVNMGLPPAAGTYLVRVERGGMAGVRELVVGR
ncbi:MAG: carboxylesterase family protein, partial [Saprospiraceae bacterium]